MDQAHLTSILEKLWYIRLVEEKICELYPEQEIRCPVHICIGQEAAAVGVCTNLNREDVVFSNHRSHGHYLAKGGNLKKFFAELYGKAEGCSHGRGGSMHLIDRAVNFMGSTPIVAGTIPVATGAALALKMQNSDSIAVVFFGDAATEEGVFYESINFAKLKKLPILFVRENNLYAVHTSLHTRQSADICNIVNAYGISCYKTDGNNAVLVYETSQKAIDTIRKGNGPVFIEILTYRWKEHCGSNEDTALGYRSEQELAEWKQKDPIIRLQQLMFDEKVITPLEINAIKETIDSKIKKAVSFAKQSPSPDKNQLNEHIYEE